MVLNPTTVLISTSDQLLGIAVRSIWGLPHDVLKVLIVDSPFKKSLRLCCTFEPILWPVSVGACCRKTHAYVDSCHRHKSRLDGYMHLNAACIIVYILRQVTYAASRATCSSTTPPHQHTRDQCASTFKLPSLLSTGFIINLTFSQYLRHASLSQSPQCLPLWMSKIRTSHLCRITQGLDIVYSTLTSSNAQNSASKTSPTSQPSALESSTASTTTVPRTASPYSYVYLSRTLPVTAS